jgi:hypothetical protein
MYIVNIFCIKHVCVTLIFLPNRSSTVHAHTDTSLAIMKAVIFLIVILVDIGYYSVLSQNVELSRIEENILYSYLKNQSYLKLLHETLIESNGVDQSSHIRHEITDEDIAQGTIENKVNIYVKHVQYVCYLVFSINRSFAECI